MRSLTHLEELELRFQKIINSRRKAQNMDPPMWAVLLPIFLLIMAIAVTT